MFDTLTRDEQDILRGMMLRGAREACKLAIFASPNATLWKAASGTANDCSAIHEELCGVGSYFTRTADWNAPASMTIRKPSPARHDWDAEAAEREQYADVMAADEADQRAADRAGA